jgi:protein gp37
MPTTIEWTNETWNPVTGCTKVSPGCAHCYAEAIDRRFHKNGSFVPWTTKAQRDSDMRVVELHRDRLEVPLRWKRPRMVFVNSMSDLFHEDVPDGFIAQVFAYMHEASWHTFQVLTKRPANACRVLKKIEQLNPKVWPLPNVWLGVSVENQRYAEERIPLLLQAPAVVRFVSCEPLLGEVDLREFLKGGHELVRAVRHIRRTGHDCGSGYCDVCEATWGDRITPEWGLDWTIVGGESGPKARPMRLEWARKLRDDCESAGVACFIKQMGSVLAKEWGSQDRKGGDMNEWPEEYRVREFPQGS